MAVSLYPQLKRPTRQRESESDTRQPGCTAQIASWTPSLFAQLPIGFDATFADARKLQLGNAAWTEFQSGWVSSGDSLFDLLRQAAPWFQEPDRIMFDHTVSVPRLTTGVWKGNVPDVLTAMARCLSYRYGTELAAISANLYRDGQDSVAWHGDRVGLTRASTVVAILSLGSQHTVRIRPTGGGPSIAHVMRSGDLLVQGGTAQRTHEHCVPKQAGAGPRISVMFREQGGE